MNRHDMKISPDALEKALSAADTASRTLLEKAVRDMAEYYRLVYEANILPNAWNRRLPAEEYQDRLQQLDSARRNAHNACILGLTLMNRVAAKHGLEPVANFDPPSQDRGDVAHAIFIFVEEIVRRDPYSKGGRG